MTTEEFLFDLWCFPREATLLWSYCNSGLISATKAANNMKSQSLFMLILQTEAAW